MLLGFHLSEPLLDGDGNNGGGGSPESTYQELLAKHNNDAVALAMSLLGDNFQWREKNRKLRTDLEEAVKRVPEGAVVLTADQAKLWERYQQLGTPDEITQIKTDRDSLQQESAKTKRDLVLQEISGLGWNLPALRDLMGDLELKLDEKDENGQKVKVALVKNGDDFVNLEEFTTQRWPHFMASLRSEGAETASTNGGSTGSAGVTWIGQGQGDSRNNQQKNVVQEHLDSQYRLPGRAKETTK